MRALGEKLVFETFTDRSKKVMALANQEAQRFNHEFLGTEHLLLGLIKEGSGIAAAVLKGLNLDLRKIRIETEKLVKSGREMDVKGKLPLTHRFKNVVTYAIEEASDLNHSYIGTEHLLLGLLRDDGVARQIFDNLKIGVDDVRSEVFNLLGHADEEHVEISKQLLQDIQKFIDDFVKLDAEATRISKLLGD